MCLYTILLLKYVLCTAGDWMAFVWGAFEGCELARKRPKSSAKRKITIIALLELQQNKRELLTLILFLANFFDISSQAWPRTECRSCCYLATNIMMIVLRAASFTQASLAFSGTKSDQETKKTLFFLSDKKWKLLWNMYSMEAWMEFMNSSFLCESGPFLLSKVTRDKKNFF